MEHGVCTNKQQLCKHRGEKKYTRGDTEFASVSQLYASGALIKNHVTYTLQPHRHKTSTFKFTEMPRSMSHEGVSSDYVARIPDAHRK